MKAVAKVREQEGEDDYDEEDVKRQCEECYYEADGVDHCRAIQYANQ
jgi:hypothetical protein